MAQAGNSMQTPQSNRSRAPNSISRLNRSVRNLNPVIADYIRRDPDSFASPQARSQLVSTDTLNATIQNFQEFFESRNETFIESISQRDEALLEQMRAREEDLIEKFSKIVSEKLNIYSSISTNENSGNSGNSRNSRNFQDFAQIPSQNLNVAVR